MATDEGTPEWTDTKAGERNNDEDEDGVDDSNSGKGISSPKRVKKEKANRRVRQFDFCSCLKLLRSTHTTMSYYTATVSIQSLLQRGKNSYPSRNRRG